MATVEGVQVAKGSSVEVKSEGEWWDATVSKVRDDKIKVHYVGGTEEEDEWIALNSGRLRLPKNTATGGEEATAKKRGRFSSYETVDPVAVPTNLPFKRSTVKDASKRRPWKQALLFSQQFATKNI